MKLKNMKTVGLVDMHPMQVECLMDFIGMTLKLAVLTGDEEIIDEVEHMCDEMIKLFGGTGVRMTVEKEPDVSQDDSRSVH